MNLAPRVEALQRGPTTFRVRGTSMEPKIRSGQLVTLDPVDGADVERGDIVLARVRGRLYLHLVAATEPDRVLITNNRGHVNGWTPREKVYGRLRK